MTTASVLLTVTTTWNVTSEKSEKEGWKTRHLKTLIADTAKELRETPANREQAIQTLREWIQQNRDIRNVREDELFLLRFLRHKKYSIHMAQQTLLKYLSLRKYYPVIFTNMDYESPNISDIINNGYIMISPVRDSKGRRVIVYNMSKFDAAKYNCWDMCRTHAVVYESLLEDPVDQVCGFTHIGDGSGATGAHVATWSPTDFARIMKWGEQSMPMRHREFHLINVPTAVKYIIDFALSKMTPKMASRLHLHSSVRPLHKAIDVACLPTTFGGPIPLQEMFNYTKQLLAEQRRQVLALEDMEMLSDRGIISSRSTNKNAVNGDINSVAGSFRKLEID